MSVFEVNIRVLGSLLAAVGMAVQRGHMDLARGALAQAHAVGTLLLPAFDTATGMPLGSLQLGSAADPDETPVTAVAAAGSYILEFGLLSRYTGDGVFERVAKRAARALYMSRSKVNLLGNHINTSSGKYVIQDAGMGHCVDSYYEYLLKGALLFDDGEYDKWFYTLAPAVERYLARGEYYMEVNMHAPERVAWTAIGALQAFWPGVLLLAGEPDRAAAVARANHAVWQGMGGLFPERVNALTGRPYPGYDGYHLRPEHVESLQALAQATRGTPQEKEWVTMCSDVLHSLHTTMRTQCGYAGRRTSGELIDRMESFFVAETLKYLILCLDEDNPFHSGWIFTTEAHPVPIAWRDIAVALGQPRDAFPSTLLTQRMCRTSETRGGLHWEGTSWDTQLRPGARENLTHVDYCPVFLTLAEVQGAAHSG